MHGRHTGSRIPIAVDRHKACASFPAGPCDDARRAERSYRKFLPVQADGSEPLPLVLVLHGTGDSGWLIQSFSGMDRLAARDGFLVAYPDSWNRARNARLPQDYAARTGAADDVRFLSTLVDDVAAIHPVVRRAVYATGIHPEDAWPTG